MRRQGPTFFSDEVATVGGLILSAWRKKGGSSFSTVLLEKTLGRPFTVRSAKTVKKLIVKYTPAKF